MLMPYNYYITNDANRNISQFKTTLDRIERAIYTPIEELKVTIWSTHEPLPFEKRFSGKQRKLKVGESWGSLLDCAWFHFSGKIPEAASGKHVVLLIDISGEACVVDPDGCPVQGLTNVNSRFDRRLGIPGKRIVQVSMNAPAGHEIELWADAGCNDLFGDYKDNGTLKEAHIAICNEEMRQLYYDFEVLLELMTNISVEKARYHCIFRALNRVSNLLYEYNEDEARDARQILAPELAKKSGDTSLTISAIGHAHIDLAWLWPIRETKRKAARTFSTAIRSMEKYKDYVFGASQPQLYQWVKEGYPSLYEKIRQHIREERWEAQGAMWVESDTNIPGGESLVRQVLYGKRFFREEFGKDMKILWLPDVFGYTASLPQILKKTGVIYFMTIKLSWSKYNKFPHHTFWWQGLDGSKVLVHMPPEGTYNSSGAPRAVIKAEKEFLDKGISDSCLMLFGIGDGGGGPGEEHLERLQRQRDLNGLVPVVQQPALDFFKKLECNGSEYKTWVGELYLEFHQGTYTTQARNKRYNRRLEIALRELEFAAVQALVICGRSYPQDELERIWKEVLLYQFHDIIPGSSITRVYDESLERYRVMAERVKQLTDEAYACIMGSPVKNSTEKYIAAINTLSWERNEWVNYKGRWVNVKVPSMAFTYVNTDCQTLLPDLSVCGEDVLENEGFKILFNRGGSIRSIFDKEHQREIVAGDSSANRLIVYEDSDNAWDFPIQYDEKSGKCFELAGAEYRVDGPRVMRISKYIYGKSMLVQKVLLTSGSRRIDFVTHVDWKENCKMLRTSFPVNIFTNEATCDIQFGSIKRPTHRNTSWDMAKYEVCAHKWVDLSQADYGVALLNDCKYGYKVLGNEIGLNLLRSTTYPDPAADRTQHEFTYSLFPHAGDYIKGGVVKAGYELNMPIRIVEAGKAESAFTPDESFIKVDSESIIVESIKKTEDDDDIIIRLYECHGTNAETGIHLSFMPKSLQLVDMMEEDTEYINTGSFDKENLKLKFRPFEIHTLRVSK